LPDFALMAVFFTVLAVVGLVVGVLAATLK
jgi:hypothetical protein